MIQKILKKNKFIAILIMTLIICICPVRSYGSTSDEYINYEIGLDLTVIPTVFITGYYPDIVDHKYIGWLGSEGQMNYSRTTAGGNFSYHYISMMDVINLFSDGSYELISTKQHKFTFGGNTVIFSENSNTVTINGASNYVGKIRYADSDKDKYRRGRFFGSKVTYDQKIKTFGTFVTAEALDEVLQYGVCGVGNWDKRGGNYANYGIKVPDKYKKTTFNNSTYPDLVYSKMKAKLPENIKSQIKEPQWNTEFTLDAVKIRNIRGGKAPMTETIKEQEEYSKRKDIANNAINSTILSTNNLLFGEDFSDIDNYDQVAKVVNCLFDYDPKSPSFKEFRNLTNEELADKFRDLAENSDIKELDFFNNDYKMTSRLYVTVYFNGKKKENGVSFAIKCLRLGNETATIMYNMLKNIYPDELVETIIQNTLFPESFENPNAQGNKKVSEFNVVQASGKYKYFHGILPEDRKDVMDGMTYFLIDNHPALPNEQFCTANYDTFAVDSGSNNIYSWGRGFREDFFTFSTLPSDVRSSLGMPEIWDVINYNSLVVSPQIRKQEGTTMQPLEKCTNNPYDSYEKLSAQ